MTLIRGDRDMILEDRDKVSRNIKHDLTDRDMISGDRKRIRGDMKMIKQTRTGSGKT